MRLSRISSIGRSGVQLVCCIRCSRNSAQVSLVIHPVLVEVLLAPGGAPIMKQSLNLTLGKTNMGGVEFPAAFTAHTTVTNSPLSADVTEPTFYFFLSQSQIVSNRKFRINSMCNQWATTGLKVHCMSFLSIHFFQFIGSQHY